MLSNRKIKFFKSLTLPADVNKEYDNLVDLVMDAQKWRQKGESSLEIMTLEMVVKHVDTMKVRQR